MTLAEVIEWWEIMHPKSDFFAGMTLPKSLPMVYLYDMILFEFGEMRPLYTDTEKLHRAVYLFWERNTPIFNALEDTVGMDYNPIDDHGYKTHRIADGTTHRDYEGESNAYRNAFNDSTASGSPTGRSRDENDTDGRWEDEYTITREGMSSHTYQELVEKQRQVVDFHVEDYIKKYWALELMVAVW